MILLDTSVLGRLPDPDDPQCRVARRAVRAVRSTGEQVAVVPQNLYEFWAAATRRPGPPPAGQNGLGMSVERASRWLVFIQRRFTVLPDRNELLPRWFALVRTLGITGLRSHDARLVAAMQTYGITTILTFNVDHFRKYPITSIDPGSL